MRIIAISAITLLNTIALTGCTDTKTAPTAIWHSNATIDAVNTTQGTVSNVINTTEGGLMIESSFEKSPSSGGKTGGVYFEIPANVEETVAGKRIRVEIQAANSGSLDNRKFMISYSTAAVGNSTWQRFDLKEGLQTYTFEYDIPEDPKKGTGKDYLGIISDTSGKGAPLMIKSASIFEAAQ